MSVDGRFGGEMKSPDVGIRPQGRLDVEDKETLPRCYFRKPGPLEVSTLVPWPLVYVDLHFLRVLVP